MVNNSIAGKTVAGQPSLFTGLFVFLLYADAGMETGRVKASLTEII